MSEQETELERALDLNNKIGKANKKARLTALEVVNTYGGVDWLVDVWNNGESALMLEMATPVHDAESDDYFFVYISSDGNSWHMNSRRTVETE